MLSGIAGADETVFLELLKGKKRRLPRARRKRGGKAAKRGLSDEQTPVLICRDRVSPGEPGGGSRDYGRLPCSERQRLRQPTQGNEDGFGFTPAPK